MTQIRKKTMRQPLGKKLSQISTTLSEKLGARYLPNGCLAVFSEQRFILVNRQQEYGAAVSEKLFETTIG